MVDNDNDNDNDNDKANSFYCAYRPEKTDSDQLDACPICGTHHVLEIQNTHTATYWVACETCGLKNGPGFSAGDKAETAGIFFSSTTGSRRS